MPAKLRKRPGLVSADTSEPASTPVPGPSQTADESALRASTRSKVVRTPGRPRRREATADRTPSPGLAFTSQENTRTTSDRGRRKEPSPAGYESNDSSASTPVSSPDGRPSVVERAEPRGSARAVMAATSTPQRSLGSSGYRRRKEAIPPKYDGQGTAFIDHLDEFTRVATFNKWTDEEKCFHLWTSVTGQAKLKMRPLTYRDDWREMVSQLTALFCSNRALDAYRNKWFNAKRGPEMDLETYGLFLLDLSRKANPASAPAEQERFAKERFMETAGSTSMRFWLAALKPPTLQEAIDLAVQYEAAYEATKTSKPDVGPAGAIALPILQPEASVAATASASIRGGPSSEKEGAITRQDLKDLVYSILGEVMSKDKGKVYSNTRRQDHDYSPETRRCYRCKKTGHLRRDCPKRNVDDDRSKKRAPSRDREHRSSKHGDKRSQGRSDQGKKGGKDKKERKHSENE